MRQGVDCLHGALGILAVCWVLNALLCLQGHPGGVCCVNLTRGIVTSIFKERFSKIFRADDKAGFYLSLQPLSSGRLAEGARFRCPYLLGPEVLGLILKFKFSCSLICSPRNLLWTSCPGSQAGCPEYQSLFHTPSF